MTSILDNIGVQYAVYDGVEPNPTIEQASSQQACFEPLLVPAHACFANARETRFNTAMPSLLSTIVVYGTPTIIDLSYLCHATGKLRRPHLCWGVVQQQLVSEVVSQVDEGMKMVKSEGCDCIISFGGGSPHDAAKGIAVIATNGGTHCPPSPVPPPATVLPHLHFLYCHCHTHSTNMPLHTLHTLRCMLTENSILSVVHQVAFVWLSRSL